ncbi:MAG: response regulator [Bacteroidales bacterium]|nr:response regulator [Bacteroidales bacterium]
MDNTRMPFEAVEAIERQKILLQISQFYNPDFQRTWESITELASPVLNADRTSIWSLSEDGSRMVCNDLFDCSTSDHSSDIELDSNLYPAYFSALESSRVIDAFDGENDPRTSEFSSGYLIPLNIKSLLDVPIRINGKLSGILCFEYVGTIRHWSVEEKEFAASMADLISAKFEALERWMAETELQASEQRYRNILDNAFVGIFKTAIDGTFRNANSSMARILEFDTVDDLLKVNSGTLYQSPEDRKRMMDSIRKEKHLRDFEVTLLSNKGNLKDCIINAYLEEGDLVGMMMDVTGQKRILKDLEEARLRAEESDRLKTSLLANMSHELRTPMNSILGFSELIMNDSDNEETQFYSKKVYTAGKRLLHTLQTILELADLEATKSKLLRKDVDLLALLSSVLPPFQSQARDKGLYLITEIDPGLKVMADENLIKLVFQNLIDNAIKFTEAGGINIDTSKRHHEGRDWAIIQFRDSGIGIDRANFEQIFQEFRQASEGYNRRYEGTGLGLTLSSKMITLMGGKITLESELGKGSLFSVWLPLYSIEEKPVTKDDSYSAEPQRIRDSKKYPHPDIPLILIVEDNQDNAELMKLYLKTGYQVDRAPDSTTALKMAQNKHYNVLLLDINLGLGMDGLQLVQELRLQKSYKETPIIAITGYTMGEDREKIMAAGCSHYIAKPFTKSVLLEKINTALNG